MHFIPIPAEQTTAITDVMLALAVFILALAIRKTGRNSDPLKGRIWFTSFVLIAFGAILGSIAHGFQMTEQTNYLIWLPINLSLGLAVAFFTAGVIYDLKEFRMPHNIFPVLIFVAVLFFVITVVIPGSFFIFIIYEGVAMLFALVAYLLSVFQSEK